MTFPWLPFENNIDADSSPGHEVWHWLKNRGGVDACLILTQTNEYDPDNFKIQEGGLLNEYKLNRLVPSCWISNVEMLGPEVIWSGN